MKNSKSNDLEGKEDFQFHKENGLFSLIYHNVSDAIFLIKAEGERKFRCVEVNASYLKQTELKREQVVGKLVEEIVPKESVDFIINKYSTAIQLKHKIKYEEEVYLPKGRCYFEITLVPILSDNGKCPYLVGMMHEITMRKIMEEELKETNQTLQKIIEYKNDTEELIIKSEKLSVVGQLAAGIAHELRNPLTSLVGFLQLLQEDPGNIQQNQNYLKIMGNEFTRIEQIIGEFLVLSKPHVSIHKKNSIKMLINHVVNLLESQAVLNNVEIKTEFETEVPVILCEENQLKQVFINLIKNAIEAMNSGGVVDVEVALQNSESIIVKVRDEGSGIPEKEISKLGDPFFTTKENGTGLGLMVCQKIIDNHDGQLIIDSDVNKGTTVKVILPIK
jgi:PAS domain S-box-containing protein